LIEALARSIRSISEFPAFKSSSLATGCVGDGMRALESRSIWAVACVEEKPGKLFEARLLMSLRDKPGRSSKKVFKLFIFGQKSLFRIFS